MTNESFEEFRREVLQDPALQETLRAEPDAETFVALVVRTGAERGYSFGAEDVKEALRESRRAWTGRWA